MVEPKITARLVLVDGGEAVGGAEEGGGFSKSENRAFRLEQFQAFRALRYIARVPAGAAALSIGSAAIVSWLLNKYSPLSLLEERGGVSFLEIFSGDVDWAKQWQNVREALGFSDKSVEGASTALGEFGEDIKTSSEVTAGLSQAETLLILKMGDFSGKTSNVSSPATDFIKSMDDVAELIKVIQKGGIKINRTGRPSIGDVPVQGPLLESGAFYSKQQELEDLGVLYYGD